MKNLACNNPSDYERRKVTTTCRNELTQAGIPAIPFQTTGEVPSDVCGELNGWNFERRWYYWSAKTSTMPLPFNKAEELYRMNGKDIRVAGHCGCLAPREWWKRPSQLPDSYHIDTQEGLNLLAQYIREHAANMLSIGRRVHWKQR